MYSATYSPEDNKLRLYSVSRLDAATFERVKGAGFKWAPNQGFFVAPMWTPSRADLLEELAGEIGDEDTSLVERAEQRAERFEVYKDKRAADAERARAGVAAITAHIPFGQPILVGHHSERRARKDAERIENGMRKAVSLWETSEYWKQRAAGALRSAKYKERADVRARRIKGLEADRRKHERNKKEAEGYLADWRKCAAIEDAEKQRALAVHIANFCWFHLPRKEGDREGSTSSPTAYDAITGHYPTLYAPRTLAEVFARAEAHFPAVIKHAERWIDHLTNRIEYERAMLDEQGGLTGEKFTYQVGGFVLVRGEWKEVVRVNTRGGAVVSVTTNCPYVPVRGLDEIRDYRAPATASAEGGEDKKKSGPLPLCNYMVADGVEAPRLYHRNELERLPQVVMTKAEYSKMHNDYKGTVVVGGSHRVRVAMIRREGERFASRCCVFLSDSKTHEPPAAVDRVAPAPLPRPVYQEPEKSPEAQEFEAMRDTLRAGVQVVVAPQLFPTRRDIAERMAELLDVQPGHRVLEPSAGTGVLIGALGARMFGHNPERGAFIAVEYNLKLAGQLITEFPLANVFCADFLVWEPDGVAKFDRVIMNPPFENGADIKHILRALSWLQPGGRLVAICANGPRQQEKLRPLADHWEELPADAFAHAGTNVRAALLVINK